MILLEYLLPTMMKLMYLTLIAVDSLMYGDEQGGDCQSQEILALLTPQTVHQDASVYQHHWICHRLGLSLQHQK